jgi:hypothetical protein
MSGADQRIFPRAPAASGRRSGLLALVVSVPLLSACPPAPSNDGVSELEVSPLELDGKPSAGAPDWRFERIERHCVSGRGPPRLAAWTRSRSRVPGLESDSAIFLLAWGGAAEAGERSNGTLLRQRLAPRTLRGPQVLVDRPGGELVNISAVGPTGSDWDALLLATEDDVGSRIATWPSERLAGTILGVSGSSPGSVRALVGMGGSAAFACSQSADGSLLLEEYGLDGRRLLWEEPDTACRALGVDPPSRTLVLAASNSNALDFWSYSIPRVQMELRHSVPGAAKADVAISESGRYVGFQVEPADGMGSPRLGILRVDSRPRREWIPDFAPIQGLARLEGWNSDGTCLIAETVTDLGLGACCVRPDDPLAAPQCVHGVRPGLGPTAIIDGFKWKAIIHPFERWVPPPENGCLTLIGRWLPGPVPWTL